MSYRSQEACPDSIKVDYSKAMRRYGRNDFASAIKHYEAALSIAEKSLPAESLIRSALYVKLSMAESAARSDAGESDGAGTVVPRLCRGLELMLQRNDDLFTLTASEWAFVDPEANGQTIYDTWREVLGLESFLLAIMHSFTLHSDGELIMFNEDPWRKAMFLAPKLICDAYNNNYQEERPFYHRTFIEGGRRIETCTFTDKSPIWKLCRHVVDTIQDCVEMEGEDASRFDEMMVLLDELIPLDDGGVFFEGQEQKMRRAQEEHDTRLGLEVCALPTCGASEAHARRFKACSRCRNAYYCCADHQKQHWKLHKASCSAEVQVERKRAPRVRRESAAPLSEPSESSALACMPSAGEVMDGEWPAQIRAFGDVERRVWQSHPSSNPLAISMQKAYNRIVHAPEMNYRNVRKRNQQAVTTLMEGIHAFAGMAFNLAELFYNGAPGIPPDWNRTLHLYVCAMEAEDAKGAFVSRRPFLRSFVNNLVGVIDSMELEGMAPVAGRLEAACNLAWWSYLPEVKLAATFGRARYAYVQSRRVQAVEEWKAVSKMGDELKDQPLLLMYVEKARYQIAKMQNTLTGGGDEGMVAINARHQEANATLQRAVDALPESKNLTYSSYKEPDRTVVTCELRVPDTTPDLEAIEWVRNNFEEDLRTSDDDASIPWSAQVSQDPIKSCANGCGRKAYTIGKNRSAGAGKFRLMECSRCRDALYCSPECQRAHWPEHSKHCLG